jgi:hypothetical protein
VRLLDCSNKVVTAIQHPASIWAGLLEEFRSRRVKFVNTRCLEIMSKGGIASVFAVAALAGGALLAFAFKDDIAEALQSEEQKALKRAEGVVAGLEKGLLELEDVGSKGHLRGAAVKKLLTGCSVDVDSLFSFLDKLQVQDEATRNKRKALIERTNAVAERLDTLNLAFLSNQ